MVVLEISKSICKICIFYHFRIPITHLCRLYHSALPTEGRFTAEENVKELCFSSLAALLGGQ